MIWSIRLVVNLQFGFQAGAVSVKGNGVVKGQPIFKRYIYLDVTGPNLWDKKEENRLWFSSSSCLVIEQGVFR